MKKLTVAELFSENNFDSEKIIKRFKDGSQNLSSYSSILELVSLGIYLENIFSLIESSDRPRTIILETWLVLDELLKRTILKGLGLNILIHSNLNILPFSFIGKLELLDQIIQSEKTKKPNFSSKLPVIPGSMFTSMMKDKAFFNKLAKFEAEYYSQENIPASYPFENQEQYRFTNDEWLNAMLNLAEDWKIRAKKINKVRNLASHTINEDSIYKELGLNGKDRLINLREFCLSTLSVLTGYTP